MPMPMHIEGDKHRIYFGSRDSLNRPSVSYIDILINDSVTLLGVSPQPVLLPGEPGCFDDNGLYPGNIIRVGSKIYMYYMGRSNGESGMYYMSIGLAISEDNGRSFRRYSPAPILSRSTSDPWMVTTPWVMRKGHEWFMWYTSGIGWSPDLKTSYYQVKQTWSIDGLVWGDESKVAIPLGEGETNIAAPTIYFNGSEFEMWYSVVSGSTHSYQLGYAVSSDGQTWQRRKIDSGLHLSDNGWDANCMAYSSVFNYSNKLYMVYSGNELGKGGIGLAVREE